MSKILNLGMFFIFLRKTDTNPPDPKSQDLDENNLLCRFVKDGFGNKLGESIAIDNDIMIIKSGKDFLGIPFKHILEEEKTLLVRGPIDNEKAKEMGKNWLDKTLRSNSVQEDKD
ncbi:MAG: hypothetical protein JXA91_00160 [Candidatus Thermoplasmatota archaeon]|nr:hypothetical protein [Candidatus Thermoplasmatota archaeon]